MADGPCAYEKWIRERFSENLRPSACRHHRSFLCIAARRLAMAWSFSTSFPKPLELLGGLLSGKILRAACLVKRTTSITGALRATFFAPREISKGMARGHGGALACARISASLLIRFRND